LSLPCEMIMTERQEKKWTNRKGFTLVEMLVVMVMIALLAALVAPRLFPKLGKGKQGAAPRKTSLKMQSGESTKCFFSYFTPPPDLNADG